MGRQTLDLLALHNKIQSYHLKLEGIPNYINILKDAQKQARRAGQIIANETLLLFVTTAMLTTARAITMLLVSAALPGGTYHPKTNYRFFPVSI